MGLPLPVQLEFRGVRKAMSVDRDFANLMKNVDENLHPLFDRVRRDAIEECAQIVLREAKRLRDEGDEYDQYIVEKLLVLAEAILK